MIEINVKFHFLAFILILGLLLNGCGWNAFRQKYSATAEILVWPEGMPVPSLSSNEQYDWEVSHALDVLLPTEIEIMKSEELLSPIITELKLDEIWGSQLGVASNKLSMQASINYFHKILRIDRLPGTANIKITAYSEAPQEAADIANAVADHYKLRQDQAQAARDKLELDTDENAVVQQQKVVDDKKAEATNAPADSISQHELEVAQDILTALNSRLEYSKAKITHRPSPVQILTRATAPLR